MRYIRCTHIGGRDGREQAALVRATQPPRPSKKVLGRHWHVRLEAAEEPWVRPRVGFLQGGEEAGEMRSS
jgi:hypothetical protein